MKINEREFKLAAERAGLSPAQITSVWQQLSEGSEVEGRFEAAHVGYFFGALLVIGAMGWFITDGWDSFHG